MEQIFPYANIIAGILIFIVGFVFHWLGQLISAISWDFATKIGFQEKGMPAEYKIYEHGMACADAAIGWIYGIAALGLILDKPWGYLLAWFPGTILVYHGVSFWFWHRNQKKYGRQLTSDSFRTIWCVSNVITGVLAVWIAWRAF